MNLTGSRPTLIANVCALILASAVAVETVLITDHYIAYGRKDIGSPGDFWVNFIPVLAMFVIRNRTLSYWLLFFYCLLSVSMFLDAQAIHLGTYRFVRNPWGSLLLFSFVFVGSLAIHAVITLARILVRMFRWAGAIKRKQSLARQVGSTPA